MKLKLLNCNDHIWLYFILVVEVSMGIQFNKLQCNWKIIAKWEEGWQQWYRIQQILVHHAPIPPAFINIGVNIMQIPVIVARAKLLLYRLLKVLKLNCGSIYHSILTTTTYLPHIHIFWYIPNLFYISIIKTNDSYTNNFLIHKV